MSTRLLAELEVSIQDWIENHFEDDDWPQIWCYELLAAHMASAAYAVFVANESGQKYKEEVEE